MAELAAKILAAKRSYENAQRGSSLALSQATPAAFDPANGPRELQSLVLGASPEDIRAALDHRVREGVQVAELCSGVFDAVAAIPSQDAAKLKAGLQRHSAVFERAVQVRACPLPRFWLVMPSWRGRPPRAAAC